MDGGHRAVIFDRFKGVRPNVIGEGTHFIVPWVQKPIIFDIRSRPRSVPTITGSKGVCIMYSVFTNSQLIDVVTLRVNKAGQVKFMNVFKIPNFELFE